jgi:hypothetical protein
MACHPVFTCCGKDGSLLLDQESCLQPPAKDLSGHLERIRRSLAGISPSTQFAPASYPFKRLEYCMPKWFFVKAVLMICA